MILPNMQCARAEMAPGTVARENEGKLFLASSVAKPEFCMPISIAIVRLFFSERAKYFEIIYPMPKPRMCNKIIAIIRLPPVCKIASFFTAKIKSTIKTIAKTAKKGVKGVIFFTILGKITFKNNPIATGRITIFIVFNSNPKVFTSIFFPKVF